MDASVELVRRLLPVVVHIHTQVPSAHPSTRMLGDERTGTGTVIDPSGLILTVNYVVMGGETIHVSFAKGRTQRAELVAQDFELGLAPQGEADGVARGARELLGGSRSR